MVANISHLYYIATLLGVINFQEGTASEEENFFIPDIAEDHPIAEELEGVDLPTAMGRQYFDAFIRPRVMQEFEEASRQFLEDMQAERENSPSESSSNSYVPLPVSFQQGLQTFTERTREPHQSFARPFSSEEDQVLIYVVSSLCSPFEDLSLRPLSFWMHVAGGVNGIMFQRYSNYVPRACGELLNRVQALRRLCGSSYRS